MKNRKQVPSRECPLSGYDGFGNLALCDFCGAAITRDASGVIPTHYLSPTQVRLLAVDSMQEDAS
jgi:hypothetical protein